MKVDIPSLRDPAEKWVAPQLERLIRQEVDRCISVYF